jgi:DNA-binding CsgD family transcriptional regulator
VLLSNALSIQTGQRDRELIGRTREAALLEEFLARTEMLPGAIHLIGEPGIGKSTIWERALVLASGRGYTILAARPEISERSLAFAALGDLLGSVHPLVADQLPDPQRRALDAALLLDDSPEAAWQRTLGVAMLSSVRVLASRGPVLVAVDDVQWLDRATASVLSFALRRLGDEHVGVLLASRPSAANSAARPALESRLPTTEVELPGLSIGALHAIVVEQTGSVLSRPQLRRLHELSRGNPFLALELVRAVNSGRLRLDSAQEGSTSLDRLVGARLDALPADTRRCLFAVAAAAHPTREVLDLALGMDISRSIAAAAEAAIVELRGGELHFTHPLLSAAAYAAPGEQERRLLHGRLAQVIEDPVERARHLALAASAPDEVVAAAVEQAARSVFRRGAPGAAAELADLSATLTPDAAGPDRRRRVALRAEYIFQSGDTPSAAILLDGVIESTPAGPERAAYLALLARMRHFGDDLIRGIELNELALEEAGDLPELAAGLHEGIAWGLFLTRGNLANAAEHARSAVRDAELAADDVALAEALAVEAVTGLAIGRPSPGAIDRAVELEPALMHLRVLRHPSYAKAYLLLCTDELDHARTMLTMLLARADESGDESAIPSILVQLAMADYVAGDWPAGDEHARAGYDLASQSGQNPSRAALRGRQALIAVARGELTVGDSMAREALELIGADANDPATLVGTVSRGGEMATWALGAAALAAGSYAAAAGPLLALTDRLLACGLREPGELRFLPDTVEALLGLELVDDAAALTTRIEEMAVTTARSTTAGLAARSRALVWEQLGDLESARASAADSVAALSDERLPYELARAELTLGRLERRTQHRREARQTLAAAVQRFALLGAAGMESRARAEAARIGGRSQSATGLTPSEARVAELVSEGLSNKEVAGAMAISVKTVELHLSHVYAKLDVASRTELVRRMTADSRA